MPESECVAILKGTMECTPILFFGLELIFKDSCQELPWRFSASNAGCTGSVSGRGTTIPHAARHSQKKKKKIKSVDRLLDLVKFLWIG